MILPPFAAVAEDGLQILFPRIFRQEDVTAAPDPSITEKAGEIKNVPG
jgi:hypothetical protein